MNISPQKLLLIIFYVTKMVVTPFTELVANLAINY